MNCVESTHSQLYDRGVRESNMGDSSYTYVVKVKSKRRKKLLKQQKQLK